MDKVAVTQEDRELAYRIIREFRTTRWPAKEAELAHLLAISREATRIATAEACARIAEGNMLALAEEHHVLPRPDQSVGAWYQRIIATAIRLQQGSEKP